MKTAREILRDWEEWWYLEGTHYLDPTSGPTPSGAKARTPIAETLDFLHYNDEDRRNARALKAKNESEIS